MSFRNQLIEGEIKRRLYTDPSSKANTNTQTTAQTNNQAQNNIPGGFPLRANHQTDNQRWAASNYAPANGGIDASALQEFIKLEIANSLNGTKTSPELTQISSTVDPLETFSHPDIPLASSVQVQTKSETTSQTTPHITGAENILNSSEIYEHKQSDPKYFETETNNIK